MVSGTLEKESETHVIESLKNELKTIATKYIIAEYKRDIETLLVITKKEANEAIRAGELNIFTPHQFDKIISFNFIESDIPETKKVIVSVSSKELSINNSTIYYEYLYFKNFDKDWFIVKVERGV